MRAGVRALLLGCLTLGGMLASQAQTTSNIDRSGSALDQYVQKALESNLVLAQRQVELQKALNTLKDAEALFMPNVNFTAGYLTGTGGRYIDLPVGDLMNPVYRTLNQLTQSSSFPTIENARTYFFPQNQFDIRARTSVALVNPDLYHNRDIQNLQVRLKEQDVQVYKRELVKSLKTAYFQYLTALSGIKAYESGLAVTERNLRVAESLVKNGKAVPATLSRINAEIERLRSLIQETNNQADNARKYFNFLRNADLSDKIDSTFNEEKALAQTQLLSNGSALQREELKQLALAIDINKSTTAMAKRYWVPRVTSFIDLGNQTVDGLRVDRYSPYVLFGVNVDMPIWNANRNKLKVLSRELDLQAASLNEQNTRKALQMSADVATNNVQTAQNTLNAVKRQLVAAQSYLSLVEGGYKNGTNTVLELIDAQNQVTLAQTALSVSTYRVLITAADLERETAAYPLAGK